MPAAAIFDLDRTLLAGGSGRIFQHHLTAAGVADAGGRTNIPGGDALYKLYEITGENLVSMQLAKLAVRGSKGWSVAGVAAAAEAAADDLMDNVQPYGRLLLQEHAAAGLTTVLATTSPRCLVQPLADRLGIDVVLASEWAIQDGGGANGSGPRYAGRLDGPFVWGRAKMDAVKDWAREAKIDLKKSYAYSDSAFDVPMLRSVGNPVAVNPDPQLTAIATLNRWPIRDLDVPPGVIKIAGREIQDWFRPFNRPEFTPYARFDIQGVENIPADGPVIAVFNHRSYFDTTAINLTLARSGRPARFLGKKEVFDAPVIGKLSAMVGGIRVDRGTGSNEPLERAIRALRAGEMVAMAPEGTIPRGPAFFQTELKGRWGAARLAHETKAPIVPIGVWGTEKVWPRSQRLPSMVVSDPPTVRIRVGEPVDLRYRSLDADTKRIMSSLVDLLPDEARVERTPTAEELARTYPPGYKGDPTQELDRRPGTDTVSGNGRANGAGSSESRSTGDKSTDSSTSNGATTAAKG